MKIKEPEGKDGERVKELWDKIRVIEKEISNLELGHISMGLPQDNILDLISKFYRKDEDYVVVNGDASFMDDGESFCFYIELGDELNIEMGIEDIEGFINCMKKCCQYLIQKQSYEKEYNEIYEKYNPDYEDEEVE